MSMVWVGPDAPDSEACTWCHRVTFNEHGPVLLAMLTIFPPDSTQHRDDNLCDACYQALVALAEVRGASLDGVS